MRLLHNEIAKSHTIIIIIIIVGSPTVVIAVVAIGLDGGEGGGMSELQDSETYDTRIIILF